MLSRSSRAASGSSAAAIPATARAVREASAGIVRCPRALVRSRTACRASACARAGRPARSASSAASAAHQGELRRHRAGGLRRVEAGQARQHGAEPGLGREHPRFSRPGCGSAHRARCFLAEQADQHRRYGLTGAVCSAGIHDHAGQVAVRAVEG